MKVVKALVAGIALLALQTASAQEVTPKPWTFKWDARLGGVTLYEDSPAGRLIVTLGISTDVEGTPRPPFQANRERMREQMAQQTAKQLADAEPIIQLLADPQQFAQQFGVWILASDGRALPSDDSAFPLFAGKRSFVMPVSMSGGTDVVTRLAFKWDRSIALSAVVLRARDKYYVFPVGAK